MGNDSVFGVSFFTLSKIEIEKNKKYDAKDHPSGKRKRSGPLSPRAERKKIASSTRRHQHVLLTHFGRVII